MGKNSSLGQLLKEIRCEEDPQHRLQAANLLVEEKNFLDRVSYLCCMVLYDPDPEVRARVKTLLFDRYGNELDSILREEASIGEPVEVPWMLPCHAGGHHVPDQDVQDLINRHDYVSLQAVLRDPMDSERRIQAAMALAEDRSEGNLELLAQSVLFDPDEDVQQQAYQSLYRAAGEEKAERLLNYFGARFLDADEEWLLVPDEVDSSKTDPQEGSLFGIQEDYQMRSLARMFLAEKDPSRSMKILSNLCNFNDIQVNEILARVSLFDTNQQVKDFARSELEKRFGDGLEEYLQYISENFSSLRSEEDEEEYEEDDEEEDEYDERSLP